MKLTVHPLVAAAALGLLGPAALTMDEDTSDLSGEWAISASQSDDNAPAAPALLSLVPLDDQLIVDDGTGSSQAWQLSGLDRAEQLSVAGDARTERQLVADGDALELITRVHDDNGVTAWTIRYERNPNSLA